MQGERERMINRLKREREKERSALAYIFYCCVRHKNDPNRIYEIKKHFDSIDREMEKKYAIRLKAIEEEG